MWSSRSLSDSPSSVNCPVSSHPKSLSLSLWSVTFKSSSHDMLLTKNGFVWRQGPKKNTVYLIILICPYFSYENCWGISPISPFPGKLRQNSVPGICNWFASSLVRRIQTWGHHPVSPRSQGWLGTEVRAQDKRPWKMWLPQRSQEVPRGFKVGAWMIHDVFK